MAQAKLRRKAMQKKLLFLLLSLSVFATTNALAAAEYVLINKLPETLTVEFRLYDDGREPPMKTADIAPGQALRDRFPSHFTRYNVRVFKGTSRNRQARFGAICLATAPDRTGSAVLILEPLPGNGIMCLRGPR
jgi:hypothetical protein